MKKRHLMQLKEIQLHDELNHMNNLQLIERYYSMRTYWRLNIVAFLIGGLFYGFMMGYLWR